MVNKIWHKDKFKENKSVLSVMNRDHFISVSSYSITEISNRNEKR